MHVRVLVLGAGPAGYTAALYAALAGFPTVLLAGIMPGGQLTLSHAVENYPGYPAGSGPALMDILNQQAQQAGVQILYEQAISADVSHTPFTIQTDMRTHLTADAVIIATGATARWLKIPGEARFIGHGVSVCATCDGFFHKGHDVAVIGGGNVAAYEALYLSELCRHVSVIFPHETLTAEYNLTQRIAGDPKITLIPNTRVAEFLGTDRLQAVRLEHIHTGAEERLPVHGAFEAIGHIPNSDLFRDQLTLDAAGYIQTDPTTGQTSRPGVFACGDVQAPVFRQAIIAAGSGCAAALSAKAFLKGLKGNSHVQAVSNTAVPGEDRL